MNDSVHSFAAL